MLIHFISFTRPVGITALMFKLDFEVGLGLFLIILAV